VWISLPHRSFFSNRPPWIRIGELGGQGREGRGGGFWLAFGSQSNPRDDCSRRVSDNEKEGPPSPPSAQPVNFGLMKITNATQRRLYSHGDIRSKRRKKRTGAAREPRQEPIDWRNLVCHMLRFFFFQVTRTTHGSGNEERERGGGGGCGFSVIGRVELPELHSEVPGTDQSSNPLSFSLSPPLGNCSQPTYTRCVYV